MDLYKSYRKKESNFLKYLVIIVITVLLTLFADRTIQKANEIDDFAEKLDLNQNINLEVKEEKIIKSEGYIEGVLDSTVGISLIKPTGTNIFDLNVEQKWGIGTGIIVSENGYILTNQHLAKKEGARLIVTLNSGKSVQGIVVWVEENIDLAIIKIEETDLKAVKIGDSDKIKIGNEVIAIGNPLRDRI